MNKTHIAGETYLSNNSAGTYRQCPYKFHLRYKKNVVPIGTKISLYLGQKIHSALDFYYSQGGDPIDYFVASYDGGLAEEPIVFNTQKGILTPEDGRDQGIKLLEMYLYESQGDNWEVVATEQEFFYKLESGVELSGIIDLIVKDNEGYLVVDHKTLSQRMDGGYAQVDNQLTGYIVGANSLGFKTDRAMFNCLLKHKQPKLDRIYTMRTDEQIDSFLQDMDDVIQAIRQGHKYRSISRDCVYCEYYDYCLKGDKSSYFEEAK